MYIKEYTFYNNPVETKQTKKTSKPEQKTLTFCSTQEKISCS